MLRQSWQCLYFFVRGRVIEITWDGSANELELDQLARLASKSTCPCTKTKLGGIPNEAPLYAQVIKACKSYGEL